MRVDDRGSGGIASAAASIPGESRETPPGGREGVRRATIAVFLRYGLYVLVCLTLRAQLLRDFPILLTSDSWDFIGASTAIGQRLDFSEGGECGLRDIRVPGYPAFQAFFLPITQLKSDRILVLQAAVGLAGILIGWGIGRALGSRFASEVLVVFLGLNPVYLVNEHALMSEGLSLVTVLAFVLASLHALRNGIGLRMGLVLGTLLGVCTLVRINSLPFCATLAAGVLLVGWRRATPPEAPRRHHRPAVTFALAVGVASSALIAPWLWRNYALYGKPTLNAHKNRTMLMFKLMHLDLDPGLPGLRRMNRILGNGPLSYEWLWGLRTRYGVVGAEAVAGDLIREQIAGRPLRHLEDIGRGVLGFGGIYETVGDDRSTTRWWFENLIGRVGMLRKVAANPGGQASRLGFTFRESGANTAWTRGLRDFGWAYLVRVRPVLYLAFFGAAALRLLLRGPGGEPVREPAARWLTASYLTTVAFHALTLLDSDRFTTLYDWVALLVILLAAIRCVEGMAMRRASSASAALAHGGHPLPLRLGPFARRPRGGVGAGVGPTSGDERFDLDPASTAWGV